MGRSLTTAGVLVMAENSLSCTTLLNKAMSDNVRLYKRVEKFAKECPSTKLRAFYLQKIKVNNKIQHLWLIVGAKEKCIEYRYCLVGITSATWTTSPLIVDGVDIRHTWISEFEDRYVEFTKNTGADNEFVRLALREWADTYVPVDYDKQIVANYTTVKEPDILQPSPLLQEDLENTILKSTDTVQVADKNILEFHGVCSESRAFEYSVYANRDAMVLFKQHFLDPTSQRKYLDSHAASSIFRRFKGIYQLTNSVTFAFVDIGSLCDCEFLLIQLEQHSNTLPLIKNAALVDITRDRESIEFHMSSTEKFGKVISLLADNLTDPTGTITVDYPELMRLAIEQYVTSALLVASRVKRKYNKKETNNDKSQSEVTTTTSDVPAIELLIGERKDSNAAPVIYAKNSEPCESNELEQNLDESIDIPILSTPVLISDMDIPTTHCDRLVDIPESLICEDVNVAEIPEDQFMSGHVHILTEKTAHYHLAYQTTTCDALNLKHRLYKATRLNGFEYVPMTTKEGRRIRTEMCIRCATAVNDPKILLQYLSNVSRADVLAVWAWTFQKSVDMTSM